MNVTAHFSPMQIVPGPFTIPSMDDVSALEYVSSPLSTLNVRMFPSNTGLAVADNENMNDKAATPI